MYKIPNVQLKSKLQLSEQKDNIILINYSLQLFREHFSLS
jgi:hypothetical protein